MLYFITHSEYPKIYNNNMGGKQGEIKTAMLKNKAFIESFNKIKERITIPKQSTAKLVLNGLGADEVFGGYSRYYTYLRNKQMEKLKAEFALDLDRLWIRNFGRDDRCISYHNKTCAFPYLDLNVIEYAAQIPMQELFYDDKSDKLNKKVLRDLAADFGFE